MFAQNKNDILILSLLNKVKKVLLSIILQPAAISRRPIIHAQFIHKQDNNNKNLHPLDIYYVYKYVIHIIYACTYRSSNA